MASEGVSKGGGGKAISKGVDAVIESVDVSGTFSVAVRTAVTVKVGVMV